jgi:hypothetical protein
VDEKFEVSGFYRFGDFYYASGQQISPWSWLPDGRPAGRVMMVFRSADLVHWSSAKALAFARVGQRINTPLVGQQTHMGAGLWNRGNVLVGLTGLWQGPAPDERPPGAHRHWGMHVDLGLVVSNDGIHFREHCPLAIRVPSPIERSRSIQLQRELEINHVLAAIFHLGCQPRRGNVKMTCPP